MEMKKAFAAVIAAVMLLGMFAGVVVASIYDNWQASMGSIGGAEEGSEGYVVINYVN